MVTYNLEVVEIFMHLNPSTHFLHNLLLMTRATSPGILTQPYLSPSTYGVQVEEVSIFTNHLVYRLTSNHYNVIKVPEIGAGGWERLTSVQAVGESENIPVY